MIKEAASGSELSHSSVPGSTPLNDVSVHDFFVPVNCAFCHFGDMHKREQLREWLLSKDQVFARRSSPLLLPLK